MCDFLKASKSNKAIAAQQKTENKAAKNVICSLATRYDHQRLILKEFHLRLFTNSTPHCKTIEKRATISNRSVTEEQDVRVF
jgi:hypothetical protein